MSVDWLRRMQRQVRRMGGELPIDAFLPELDAGHLSAGSVRPAPSDAPAPPAEPRRAAPAAGEPAVAAAPPEPSGAAEAEWVPGVPLSDRDDARSRRRPRRAAKGQKDPDEQDLEAEIRQFMQRNERGLSEEDDLSEFLGQGIDPNLD